MNFKKCLKWTVAFIVALLVAACAWILLPLGNREANYIAHGGGEIEGHKITNSREAVLNSIDNGFKFIELDMCLTSDSVLVAAHDWGSWRWLTGEDNDTTAADFNTFKSRKILGKYTPLSADDATEIFMRHPDLTLVVDKFDNAQILTKYFSNFRTRVIVECFSLPSLREVNEAGFRTFFSCRPSKPKDFIHAYFRDGMNVAEAYTISTKYLTPKLRPYNRFLKMHWAPYTARDKKEADSLIRLYPAINYIYIDTP